MADTDIRELLVAYTGDPPPPAFSYDGVLAAGRKRRRRRRIGAACAAVLAAAGLGIALLPGAGSRDDLTFPVLDGPFWATLDPQPYCAKASEPPAGPTVQPTTVLGTRIPTEPAAHAGARISCYLAKTVPPRLDGTDFYRDPATPAGTRPLEAYPLRVFDPKRPAETTPPVISVSAVVRDARGVGEIGFGVSSTSPGAAAAAKDCDGHGCTVRTGPHGETIMVLDVRTSSGYRLVNIWIYRGDTTSFASAANGITTEFGPGGVTSAEQQKPSRPDLPLSVDDLIAIASDPAMTLFP
ncbi:hypothetical protein ACQP2F_07770 [Actinoplanes sp. CA-030573]|uniref:hypothetical protein n=1 Tax=Actinoplanes sp. CA-030573 TaxID=3239898 RepID=UPI003D938F63